MRAEDVLFGLGNSIDYEIEWDDHIFHKMLRDYKIKNEDIQKPDQILTKKDLIISILYAMKQGGGGEYFVSNPEVLREFASVFKKKHTLGGTAIRAAIAAASLGLQETVYLVNYNEEIETLLPSNIKYIKGIQDDQCYPHVIVQFPSKHTIMLEDEIFITASTNRIIYVNDFNNANLILTNELKTAVKRAKILLLSGLNAIQDEHLLDRRLKVLKEFLDMNQNRALTYFEDACYHKPSFNIIVNHELREYVNIWGMNEDEMHTYLRRNVDLLDCVDVSMAVKELYHMLNVPVLVIHTRYWALAYGNNVQRLRKALRAGINIAGTRYYCGDDFTKEHILQMDSMPFNKEGQNFASEISNLFGDSVCCEPCHKIETDYPTTIGLGDAFVGGFLSQCSFN